MNFLNWLDIPAANVTSYIEFYALGIAGVFIFFALVHLALKWLSPGMLKHYHEIRDSAFQFSIILMLILVIIVTLEIFGNYDPTCLLYKGTNEMCNASGGVETCTCYNKTAVLLGKQMFPINSTVTFRVQVNDSECELLHPSPEPENQSGPS